MLSFILINATADSKYKNIQNYAVFILHAGYSKAV